MPSVMQRIGTPNARHNLDNAYRAHLDNVDPELSKYNEVIRRRSVEDIYQQELQPAFDSFNARQKRNDRRLDVKWGCSTYLEYQRIMDERARSSDNNIDQKGKPPIREIVWQFGNPDQGYGSRNQTDESRERIKGMLLKCQEKAEARYPQLAWGDSIFHADEVSVDADDQEHGSLHLHSSFVPICYKNKQGPDAQVAFERCLKEMGFESFNAWKQDLDNIMEEVLHEYGLERTYMENHETHQDSGQWHRQQAEIRRTKDLEREADRAEERLGKINNEIRSTQVIVQSALQRVSDNAIAGVLNSPSGKYENILFLAAHCDETRFEELDQEGRELREYVLRSRTEIWQDPLRDGLDAAIGKINAQKELMTWRERQLLWKQYNEMSIRFWKIRAEIRRDIEEKLRRQRDERWAYYSTLYALDDFGAIGGMLKVSMLLAELYCVSVQPNELYELESDWKELQENTSNFAAFSRKYRDELKAGEYPAEHILERMEKLTTRMDHEYKMFQREHREQKLNRGIP